VLNPVLTAGVRMSASWRRDHEGSTRNLRQARREEASIGIDYLDGVSPMPEGLRTDAKKMRPSGANASPRGDGTTSGGPPTLRLPTTGAVPESVHAFVDTRAGGAVAVQVFGGNSAVSTASIATVTATMAGS
jgi:hypothetical protein